MSRHLIITILLILFSPLVKSQTFYGLKTGVNFTTIFYENPAQEKLVKDSRKIKTDFQAGILYRYSLNKVMFVQPELLYSRKGLKNKQPQHGEGKTYMNFVEIPVLAGMKIFHNRYRAWELGFGPYAAFWTDGKYYYLSYKTFQETTTKVDFTDKTNKYNRWDTGIFAQMAYELTSKNSWEFALRYQHGMLSSSEEYVDPVRHRLVSLSIAYLFKNKKNTDETTRKRKNTRPYTSTCRPLQHNAYARTRGRSDKSRNATTWR